MPEQRTPSPGGGAPPTRDRGATPDHDPDVEVASNGERVEAGHGRGGHGETGPREAKPDVAAQHRRKADELESVEDS